MPILAQKKVVELKEESHKFIFRPELPLINPETVFSHGTWKSILGFIEEYLYEKDPRTYPSLDEMDFTINDLCFRKAYSEFDFKRAEELFSLVGSIKYPEKSHGSTMLLIKEWDVRLYWYRDNIGRRDVVHFSAGRSNESEATWIKGGNFIYQPTSWITTRDKFLDFVDIIEKVLMGQGTPFMCRAFMKIKIPHGHIDIQYFYQNNVDIDVDSLFWKRLVSGQLNKYDRQMIKIIPPETTITIII